MRLRAALLPLVLACAGSGRTAAPSGGSSEEWPKLQRTLEGRYHAIAFSPDGKTIAAGGEWGLILWDVATGKEVRSLRGHKDVWAVAFSPDGKLLASSGDDIRLWDVATGKLLRNIRGYPEKARVRGRGLAFSPYGRLLATGADDAPRSTHNTVGLWEVDTLKAAAAVPESTRTASTMAFSPDGKTLAFAGAGTGEVRLWGVDTGRDRGTIDVRRDPGATTLVVVHCVTFSPDGKTLAVSLQYPGPKSPAPANDLIGTQIGPDWDHRDILLWDVAAGKTARQLVGHTAVIHWLAFSPDGKRLVSASGDRTVRLWDVATRENPATLDTTPHAVSRVAFSPDGKLLATLSRGENTINLWNLDRGK